MSLTVIQNPETYVNNQFTSKYSFAGNPIYYDIQRMDKVAQSVGSYGGNVAFNVGTGTAIFNVGDSVYVKASDGGNYLIDGAYTVVYAVVLGAYNWIAINLPIFSGYTTIVPNGTFINNLERANHHIITSLMINGVQSEERQFATQQNGLCRVYVNSIVNDYLSQIIDLTYTLTNRLIPNYAIPFKLVHREAWLGYEDTLNKYEGAEFYAVKSIQQINNDNRMVQYEVFYEADHSYSTAKFQTAFVKPKMWVGYPFTICSLITFSVTPITKNIKSYPSEAIYSVDLDLSAGYGVNELLINPATNSQSFEIWLNTDEGIDPSISDYVDNLAEDYVVYTP